MSSLIKRHDEERKFFLPLTHHMGIFIAVQLSQVLMRRSARVIRLSGHGVGMKTDEHTFVWLKAS